MNRIDLQQAIEFCINQVNIGLKDFKGKYPSGGSVNCIYPTQENIGWTNGFWTGMVWLAYEFTRDERYEKEGLSQAADFLRRITDRVEVEHHDMGFLYSPSCVAAYKLTGDENAKKAALLAADNLKSRFMEKGQFIQAWGKLGAEDNYRLIIDCLLNLPLLFWASDVSGDMTYKEVALKHIDTTVNVIIREDGGTYHTYFFNPHTGLPDHGVTHQGYSDDSIWARGQAWGIYGLALAYKVTKRKDILEKFMKVTTVFLEHLPSDDVPAWDMIFTDPETQKDSSAGVIAVCGMLEMNKWYELPENMLNKAYDMMAALQPDYFTSDIPGSNGILMHTVGAMPQKQCIDECSIWGDYYYMEALMRIKNPDWDSYWI